MSKWIGNVTGDDPSRVNGQGEYGKRRDRHQLDDCKTPGFPARGFLLQKTAGCRYIPGMRAFFTAILLTLAVYLPSAQARGPETDYANIYALVLQGDTLNAKGDWRTAHARDAEAQAALEKTCAPTIRITFGT